MIFLSPKKHEDMIKMSKNISTFLDIPKMQSLLEKFTDATGITNAIIDLEGNILVASGWQDICTKYFRVHPDTSKNCVESDTILAGNLKKGKTYNVYKCLNGLVDAAVPIMIGGDHMANLFIGQFFLDKPDLNYFKKKAQQLGYDEQEFLSALLKVPQFTEEEVKKNMTFLSELAGLISDMGLSKMNLTNLTVNLEKKIEERTMGIRDSQMATLNMMQDAEEARLKAEELNKELEEMMKKLQESNIQLEQFAYVASHDLQEPLRKISSFTEIFEKKYGDKIDKKGKEYLKYVTDGSRRMKDLINDLLAFSRISSQGKEFGPVDTGEIVRNIIDLYESKSESIKGVISYSNLPVIVADKIQILRLFQNLIGNSLKFKREGVIPEVSVKSEEKADKWIFSVKDNGIGIEAQYKDRIFIIFQRLHNRLKYEGTGIGLSLCKQIVNRHGGEIGFTSKPGQGSTFYFTIPKGELEGNKKD